MKIENEKLNLPTTGADGSSRANGITPGTNAGAKSTQARGDELRLSPELRTLHAATEAAAGQPAFRADLVDRMRALVQRGEVGQDATKLADALIDGAIARK